MSRLVPGRALPSYAYLPGGRHPRPSTSAHGADPCAFEWGVDLFDHGYFWEAHEAWEPRWREAEGAERALLAGLIQLAGACVKMQTSKLDAARRLSRRALGHLGRAGVASLPGVETRELTNAVIAWLAKTPTTIDGRPRLGSFVAGE